MKRIKSNFISILFILSLAVIFSVVLSSTNDSDGFIGKENAFAYLEKQLSFGPRTPGSEAHQAFIEWASDELENKGWSVQLQHGSFRNKPVTNVIAERLSSTDIADPEWILLGAHFDSRLNADADPNIENHELPVMGANDGASGVALLMELAATLPETPGKDIWLVLFDAEDQGNIPGWENWCVGSTMMARSFAQQDNQPDKVVIVDMVGDKNLEIFRERNSDTDLTDEIWNVAAKKGFDKVFVNEPKYSIYDDHVPFLQIGIPAIDIIDFDYPAWHTLQDDIQNVSSDSLAVVSQVLYSWLTEN
jgi:hypothetical protein